MLLWYLNIDYRRIERIIWRRKNMPYIICLADYNECVRCWRRRKKKAVYFGRKNQHVRKIKYLIKWSGQRTDFASSTKIKTRVTFPFKHNSTEMHRWKSLIPKILASNYRSGMTAFHSFICNNSIKEIGKYFYFPFHESLRTDF